ncbi:hypothetical protein J1614_011223 [Plenodomus biglobosus]|nr:hypothetical protein J1614_011223 [Plenodomus biglobosus]
MIISGPNLPLVQATGALAFYFLVIGHVSRAWVMIGISMRLALALGLHLRNEDPKQSDAKREPIVRTWWCIYSIECLISSVTGRPPVIAPEDCTVLPPKIAKQTTMTKEGGAGHSSHGWTGHVSPPLNPSPEGALLPGAESRYFLNRINVALISQRVLLSLYSPRTAARSWMFIQDKVKELLNDLKEWQKVALPVETGMSDTTKQLGLRRGQFLLQISYLSTKILITRPCLCRIDRRIPGESTSSTNFNAKTAETCVEAACELTALFPDEAKPDFIYSQGPWWEVVHIIMQSLAALLLETVIRGKNAKGETNHYHIGCIRKLIRWLRAMGAHDEVAERAHHVILKILNSFDASLQSQATEILAEDVEDHDHDHAPYGVPYEEQQHHLWRMSEPPNESFRQTQPPVFDDTNFRPQAPGPMQGYEYGRDI